MIYYRKFILEYLNIPGVHYFCIDDDTDYNAFYSRFFGDKPQGRANHPHIRKILKRELDSMVEDGIIEVQNREVRNAHDNRSRRIPFYLKKQLEAKY